MGSFDLVGRPWLPCIAMDGTGKELGLRQTLREAHALRELFDPSPLVTGALHRLLLAILHRAYAGPADSAAWREIWNAGRFDPTRIDTYLDRWRHRFDLFDPERPFYQVAVIPAVKDAKSIARLATELSSGSNATLFDHSIDKNPVSFSFAQAARTLVAAQAFALAGGNSKPFNFSHGAMVAGYSVLAVGESLFETLALNLQPYNRHRPFEWLHDDRPCWEQAESAVPRKGGTPVAGYTDYLTSQSRRIRLIPDEGVESVTNCQVAQNLTVQDSLIDPFKCYRRSKQQGWLEQKFAPERALWRDSTILFQQLGSAEHDSNNRRPELMNWLGQIHRDRQWGRIQAKSMYRLHAFGLTTGEKAGSAILWRREELPLPLAILEEPRAIVTIAEAVDLADRVNGVLTRSSWELARLLLAPMSDQKDAREPDFKKSVQPLAESLGIEPRFWPRLAEPFAAFLTHLPDDRRTHPDDPEEIDYGHATFPVWSAAVEGAARRAFTEGTAGLDRSARALKAVAVARQQFERSLARATSREEGVAA